MKHFYLHLFFVSAMSQAQFQPPIYIDAAGTNGSIHQIIKTSDLNHDGWKDIVVGNDINDGIRIFRNRGGLQFDTAFDLSGNWQNIESIALGDLDNDGFDDLVVLDDRSQTLTWQKNIDGTFSDVANTIDLGLIVTFSPILCHDFTGDGNLDLIILNHFDAFLYTNNGLGNFSGSQSLIPKDMQTELYDIVMGDFNNDGFKDLAISSDGFHIFLNDGEGHFSFSQQQGSPVLSFLLDCADYNNDGFDDVLMDGPILKSYLNTGGVFQSAQAFNAGNENYQTLFSGDLDNDGDVDVLTQTNQVNKVLWFANDGLGQFGAQQIIFADGTQSAPYCVYGEDLDNDSDLDVIWSSGSGVVAIQENQTVLSKKDFKMEIFTLFPNPTSENLQFLSSDKIAQIDIYNTLGQLITTIANPEKVISVSDLNRGVYTIVAKFDNTSVTQRLLKK